MHSFKRPKNLAERLLRISRLHIFELYLFRCVLHTSGERVQLDVERVEKSEDTIVFHFESLRVVEALTTDCYLIADDQDYLVAQRYFDNELTYQSGDIIRMVFEVKT